MLTGVEGVEYRQHLGGIMFGGRIGWMELIIILAIVILIFGPKKLGELGKGLGEGIRGFKSSMKDATPDDSVEKKH
jgi:sec-independent protein translocase protein TatA